MRVRAVLFGLMLAALPRVGQAAIVPDAGFPKIASNATGANASVAYTTAGTNRTLSIVCFATDDSADPYPINIGGSALAWTERVHFDPGGPGEAYAIFTASAPGVTTETVTCGRSSNVDGVSGIAVFSLSGAQAGGGATALTGGSSGEQVKVSILGISTTSYLVGALVDFSASGAFAALATTTIEVQKGDAVTGSRGAAISDATPTAGTVVIGSSSTSTEWVAGALEIKVAAAAGTGTGGMMGFF